MFHLALRIVFVVLLAVSPASSALATDLLDNGMTNTVNSASTDLAVTDGATATVLDVVDGAEIAEIPDPEENSGRSVGVSGTSILNLAGGQLVGSLSLGDSAIANISGGIIGNDLSAEGDGVSIAMSGGLIDDDVFLGGGTFTMSGGEVGDQFFATGTSKVILTDIAGPINDDLFIQDMASLEMAGSSLGDELFVQGNATATITGGYIDDDLNANDDAMITVAFVEIDDSVDAAGNGIIEFQNGIVHGGFEAADNSTINVTKGTFESIFSDGEVAVAVGGSLSIEGGTFGTPGVNDGGFVGSTLGGTVNFVGGEIAGLADGTAPTALVNATLNGITNLSGITFDELILEAGNSGILNVDEVTASSIEVKSIAAGSVQISSGQSAELSITSEIQGAVTLTGGEFGDIEATLDTESVLTIVGGSFTVNGVALEDVDATFGDADAFIEDTGELRLVAGTISGTLADGHAFDLAFTRSFAGGNASQIFLQTVPEPSSLALGMVSLLGLFGIRRSRN